MFLVIEIFLTSLHNDPVSVYDFGSKQDAENHFRQLMREFNEDFTEKFIAGKLQDGYYYHEDYHLTIKHIL